MLTLKRLLWYLIAGTKGGVNRARIIDQLHQRPYNANQLAENLQLDYKTIQHHLKVLEENSMIIVEGNGYGNLHFLSTALERNYDLFLEIWGKITEGEKK